MIDNSLYDSTDHNSDSNSSSSSSSSSSSNNNNDNHNHDVCDSTLTCLLTNICKGPARVKKPFSSVAVMTTVSITSLRKGRRRMALSGA